jgi:hypothetical protein
MSAFATENKFKNVKTMRRLYRTTLQMPAIGSKGQSAHIRAILKLSRQQELLFGQVASLKCDDRRVLTTRPPSPRKTGENNGIIIIGQV